MFRYTICYHKIYLKNCNWTRSETNLLAIKFIRNGKILPTCIHMYKYMLYRGRNTIETVDDVLVLYCLYRSSRITKIFVYSSYNITDLQNLNERWARLWQQGSLTYFELFESYTIYSYFFFFFSIEKQHGFFCGLPVGSFLGSHLYSRVSSLFAPA